MNALQRAVQRREAIRQAAIVDRSEGPPWDLSPMDTWAEWGGDVSAANQATIGHVTRVIEAYERVMASPYIHGGSETA